MENFFDDVKVCEIGCFFCTETSCKDCVYLPEDIDDFYVPDDDTYSDDLID